MKNTEDYFVYREVNIKIKISICVLSVILSVNYIFLSLGYFLNFMNGILFLILQ